MLERMVDLRGEISVIVARDDDGNLATWPVSENRHRDGILDMSIVPARVDPGLAAEARSIATAIAAALDYRGVLCVELFVAPGDALVVNEIAPRPHNSGHYTIDACVTSQFEQQARILAALPMGDTLQHTPAVMLNLLGDIWFADATAAPCEPDWARVLAHPQAKLHLYGKRDARRGRKMGHVTCLGATLDDALATAGAIRRELGIPDGDDSVSTAGPSQGVPPGQRSGDSRKRGHPARRHSRARPDAAAARSDVHAVSRGPGRRRDQGRGHGRGRLCAKPFDIAGRRAPARA